jgi:hypothetical protein
MIHGSAVAGAKHRSYIVHSEVQLLAHRRLEPAPMTLGIIIRVAMQEGTLPRFWGRRLNNK